MHGASQWGTLRRALHRQQDRALRRSLVRRRRRLADHREGARADARDHRRRDGAAADRGARRGERGARPRARLFVLASTAAVFSPSVKQQFKERFPNLIVVDSVGASETGFHGTSLYQAGESATARTGVVRVRPGRDTLVVGDDGRPLAPGSGVVGKLARTGNVPLGYYKDPKKTAETFVEVDGRRYAIPGDFATLEADGTHRAARPRLGLHQLGRREGLPRGGRGRAQGAPGRVRRGRRRRARPALGRARRGRRSSRARAARRRSTRSPRTAATRSPATRFPARSTSWSGSSAARAGSPTIPGPRRWPPSAPRASEPARDLRIGAPMRTAALRRLRHRRPDLRLQPLPRRRRRRLPGGRLRRAGRPRLLARAARDRAASGSTSTSAASPTASTS